MYIELFSEDAMQKLVRMIEKTDRAIKQGPEGTLTILRDREYLKWYRRVKDKHGHQLCKYIRQADKPVALQLAWKGYNEALLKDLKNEEILFRRLEVIHKRYPTEHLVQYLGRPGIKELLMNEDLWKWMHEEYETKNDYDETRTHQLSEEISVRSKSEELIMLALEKHNIPFRYEAKTRVGSRDFYPDYTCRHPKNGELKIWEHFGLMDDQNYRSDTGWKLQQYIQAGFTPGLDLIITSETRNHSFTYLQAEQIISQYFS